MLQHVRDRRINPLCCFLLGCCCFIQGSITQVNTFSSLQPFPRFLPCFIFAWIVKGSGKYYHGNMATIQSHWATVLDVAHDISKFKMCVCPATLFQMSFMLREDCVRNLYLIYEVVSNSLSSKPPFLLPHFCCLPLPVSHHHPLIPVLSVAVSPWIPDHSLEISVGFLLAPSPCCYNFNLPGGLKGLPGASGSTICPLTLCLGDGGAG